MAQLRTLVVDDEPVARQLLRSVLRDHPSVELIGESDNGADAIAAIRSRQPDLVLLDIQMPEADGFQVVEALDAGERPAVIFVTAFDRYALRAFRVHAIDYLLKPVDDRLLIEAVDRTAARLGTAGWQALQARLDQMLHDPVRQEGNRQWFLARQGDQRIPLRWRDVEWFESAQNYVRAHIRGQTFLIRRTLQGLEQQLVNTGFVRVHRSAIVNVAMIRRLLACGHGDFEIELSGGGRVTLSRRYRKRLEDILGSLS